MSRVQRTSNEGPLFTSGQVISPWPVGRVHPTPTTVPIGWNLYRLTSVARLESGHTPSRRIPDYWDGDIPWISLHDSERLDALVLSDTSMTVSQAGLENSSARLLPIGTVSFSRTAIVGKATIMGREMATSQDFANFICGEHLHNRYLAYLFRFMGPEWDRLMAGSTHNSVYMPTFQELAILVPPREEQVRISDALSDADALIESLKELLAKKRQIKQGAMQELLTGKRRIAGFTTVWRTCRLGEIARMRSGGTPDSTKPENFDGQIPWVSILDMTQGGKTLTSTERNLTTRGLASSSAQLFPPGTVLFAMYASIGECSIAGCSLSTSQAILGISPGPKLNAEYLYYWLCSQKTKLTKLGQQGTQANLNKGMVENLVLELPSLPEQCEIVRVLSSIDTLIENLKNTLSKARQLKQAMMQELLTGRIRLV